MRGCFANDLLHHHGIPVLRKQALCRCKKKEKKNGSDMFHAVTGFKKPNVEHSIRNLFIFRGFNSPFQSVIRMKKIASLVLLFLLTHCLSAQSLSPLTVEKIMRDQKWIGTSPSNMYWSADGRFLFFSWNPTNSESDSVYYITLSDRTPKKASYEMR